jgi:hypothetical protein
VNVRTPKRTGHAARGQVIPIWTLGAVSLIAMTLFMINYANVMRWQIRAQNAADTAAEAAVVASAEGFDELSLVMYTTSVAEMRLRYLNQALLNNLQGLGCSTTSDCESDYNALVAELQKSIQTYDDSKAALVWLGENVNDRYFDSSNGAFETITGYQYADGRQDAACVSAGVACVNQTDQAFTYTPLDIDAGDVGFGTPNTAEVASCKSVPLISPKLIGLASGATFRAVGIGAFTIVSVPETFTAGALGSASTTGGTAYQPVEYWAPDKNTYYAVDYSGLTDTVFFYVPNPTSPYKTFDPSTANCS